MIITNGVSVISVTKGAYEGIFKHQGYYPVEPKIQPIVAEAPKIAPVVSEVQPVSLPYEAPEDTSETNSVQEEGISEVEAEVEEKNDTVLSEIPLSEMTQDQLRAYAKELGVDIKGLKNRKAVIDRIRASL